MSCASGNCGGGCNSCHGCGEKQYGSNCYPILNVNCLPTISRTTSHYIYRTPDDKLWYVNRDCNAWLELSPDNEGKANQNNVIIELRNDIIELREVITGNASDKSIKEQLDDILKRIERLENR